MLAWLTATLLDHAAPVRANRELPVEIVDGIEKNDTCKHLPDAAWIDKKRSHGGGLEESPLIRQEGKRSLNQIETSGRKSRQRSLSDAKCSKADGFEYLI